ncbi:19322_t:CDS:2 [Dentiscutata erythropus]|uniref:19322_t:CDS:1 n=1 Tax=Dentiscutata erythropus TaxID=1348616 RepID=A0A9N9E2B5_9GLOM|nr:19322_t:CDS:2 [Dentiscutata erythropus]
MEFYNHEYIHSPKTNTYRRRSKSLNDKIEYGKNNSYIHRGKHHSPPPKRAHHQPVMKFNTDMWMQDFRENVIKKLFKEERFKAFQKRRGLENVMDVSDEEGWEEQHKATSLLGAYSSFAYIDNSTAFTTSLGYINGVWHIIKGVVCLGGLYGAIAQNRNMVHLFAVIISVTAMIHLVFGIGLAIVGIKNRENLVNLCLSKASSSDSWNPEQHWLKPFDKRQADSSNTTTTVTATDNDKQVCETAVKWYLAFFIVFTAIAIILTFYFAAVVYRYRDELDEKIKHTQLKNQSSGSSSFEDRYSREYPEKPLRGISTNV